MPIEAAGTLRVPLSVDVGVLLSPSSFAIALRLLAGKLELLALVGLDVLQDVEFALRLEIISRGRIDH
ncbi:hypothetical protein AO398_07770 [Methylobacterium sp. GXS13]|nr:hypothetical protein AO398_07770 [Methylobacterium sp. GXS13]